MKVGSSHLKINGMHCTGCEDIISEAVERLAQCAGRQKASYMIMLGAVGDHQSRRG